MEKQASVHIYTLGTVCIKIQTKTGIWEEIPTSRWRGNGYARSILAILLSSSKRQASRDALIDALWPQGQIQHATVHINTAINLLRKILEDHTHDLLLTWGKHGQAGYRLADQSLIWTDADAAQDLMLQAETVGYASSCGLMFLEQAEKLFERGIFLEQEEGLWCYGRRSELEAMAERCRLWLIEAYMQQGYIGKAECLCNQMLLSNPTNQAALQRLFALYQYVGMDNLAKKRYQDINRQLQADEQEELPPFQELIKNTTYYMRYTLADTVTSPTISTNINHTAFPSSLLHAIIPSVQEWSSTSMLDALTPTEKDDMNKQRRELFHLLGMAGVALSIPSPLRNEVSIQNIHSQSTRLDQSVLRDLETINHSLWQLYIATPIKTSVLESALGQMKTLMRFLKMTHGEIHYHKLCALTSEMSQLTGEIFFDSSDYDAAQSCYTLAATCAREAQSYDLWACALVRHAFLPFYRSFHKDALQLLQEAYTLSLRGDSSLATRYWVAAVQAEVQASMLNVVDCQKSLDLAQDMPKIQEIQKPWIRFTNVRFPALRGSCYVRLQKPDLALPVLQEALQHFGRPDRKRGLVLIDLIQTVTQSGDVEQACSYVDEVISILNTGSSPFLRESLRTVSYRLKSNVATAFLSQLDQHIHQQLQLLPA